MVKDVRLCLEEAKALGLSMEVAEAVGRLWEVVIREMGPESDFTSAIKPIEKAAGVMVGGLAHNHGAGRSIAIRSSTSTRGRTTAYWSSLTSTSGTSARVL